MPSSPWLVYSRIRELLLSQERMFQNFVESIAANLTKRVDDLVTKIADLKASLEFSQNDIEKHKTQITLLDTNLQSVVEEITKLLLVRWMLSSLVALTKYLLPF